MTSTFTPKKEKEKIRLSSFSKKKISNGSLNDTNGSVSLEKDNEKRKNKDKELDKEKEKQTDKLIKNILSINLAEFKETIHKEYLQFQHRINDSLQSYSQKLKNIFACEKRLIEQYADIKIKTEKIELNSEKLSKIDERLTTYEIRLTNLLRDFRSSCSKYDMLFIDNMSVPGKIGNYCKYRNIKEFLSYAFNKFEEFDLKKEGDIAKMKNNQEKIDKLIQKTNIEMSMLREEGTQMLIKKAGYIEQKLGGEIKDINKRIESIPNNILLCDIEKRMGDLMDKFNYIKDIKDEMSNKFDNIENSIESLKEDNKDIENKIKALAQKEKAQENFANISNSNLKVNRRNKKSEGNNSPSPYNKKKSSNSQKNVNKYYYLSVNKSNFYKNSNNKSQNNNLNDINENFDENNDDTSVNKFRIKSIKFSSSKKMKSSNLEKNNKKNDFEKKNKSIIINKSITKELASMISNSDKNSSEDNDNIEIMEKNDNNKKEKTLYIDKGIETNNLFENIELLRANSNSVNISNNDINKIFNKNKSSVITNNKINIVDNSKMNNDFYNHKIKTIQNSFSFPNNNRNINKDKKKEYNKSSTINPKIKLENNLTFKNSKNLVDVTNMVNKNKTIEISTFLVKEHSYINHLHKKDSIIARNNTEDNISHNLNNIISNNDSIDYFKNNDIKENNNHIILSNIKTNINNKNIQKENKKTNIQNLEIVNSNTNTINTHENKFKNGKDITSIFKNKLYEGNKINHNFTTSLSIGSITDASLLNNFHLNNNEIFDYNNNSKMELPVKQAYYKLFQIENLKKEELQKNNKPVLFIPKDIPIVTNSSKSHSQSHPKSKAKLKNKKAIVYSRDKDKNYIKEKNQEKDKNIQLKVVPTNFKESKKMEIVGGN